MTTTTKIYLGAAALLAVMIAAAAIYMPGVYRIRRAEREVDAARTATQEAEISAAAAEQRAAEYKEKLDFIESQLGEITEIARRQDNELKALNTNSNNARRNVERARSDRPVDTTTEQLCDKLAELGHPCD